MKSSIMYKLCGLAAAKVAFGLAPNQSQSWSKLSPLSAMPSPAGQPWGSRGVPSKTARESAFNVEWEPMSELERRIEDGANYEYIPTTAHQRHKYGKSAPKNAENDDLPLARGVFCGYRYTDEERDRLKCANPDVQI